MAGRSGESGSVNAALASVLLDPKEAHWPGKDDLERKWHWFTQRACLMSLSRIAPLDRLRSTLLDPRVSRHPWVGIRAHVAVGLANLRVENRKAFDILCDSLVDEDQSDTRHLVRSEAWLSLWTLTGLAPGVPGPKAFLHRPKRSHDLATQRWKILARSQLRPGVDRRQVQIVARAVRDLAGMKKTRETFLGRWETIRQRWNEENLKDEK